MTAQTTVQDEPQGRSGCWCCGRIEDPAKLVHLGNHPDMTVCTRCAHSISKWAWEIEDQSTTGLPVRARDEFRRLRKAVATANPGGGLDITVWFVAAEVGRVSVIVPVST
jgi:hypothetical protein